MMRLIYIIHIYIHTLVLDHSKCMYSFSKRRQGRMSSKLKKWYHENAVFNAVFPQGQKGSASFQISLLDTTWPSIPGLSNCSQCQRPNNPLPSSWGQSPGSQSEGTKLPSKWNFKTSSLQSREGKQTQIVKSLIRSRLLLMLDAPRCHAFALPWPHSKSRRCIPPVRSLVAAPGMSTVFIPVPLNHVVLDTHAHICLSKGWLKEALKYIQQNSELLSAVLGPRRAIVIITFYAKLSL